MYPPNEPDSITLRNGKKGFLEHAAPNDAENFPFIVMGNKCDAIRRTIKDKDKYKDDRQVTRDKARDQRVVSRKR